MISFRSESLKQNNKSIPTTNLGYRRLWPRVLSILINSTMKGNWKIVLKLGAAVLVGAAVFVGSTGGTSKKKFSSEESSGDKDIHHSESGEGLRNIQGVMMRTSQLITTLITVSESVSRLFSVDPAPRYASSTLVL